MSGVFEKESCLLRTLCRPDVLLDLEEIVVIEDAVEEAREKVLDVVDTVDAVEGYVTYPVSFFAGIYF